MKVIENRKIWFIISLVIIVAGFVSLIFRGLNYDIEFVTIFKLFGQELNTLGIGADTFAYAEKVAAANLDVATLGARRLIPLFSVNDIAL